MTHIEPIIPRHVRNLSYLGPWENRERSGSAASTRRYRWSLGDGGIGAHNGIRMLYPTWIVGVTVDLSKHGGTDHRAAEIGVFIDPRNEYPQETPAVRALAMSDGGVSRVPVAIHFEDTPVAVSAGSLIQVDVLNYWKNPTRAGLETAMATDNNGTVTLDLAGTITVVIEH